MSTLLDSSDLVVVESPSGKYHVEGWYGETICGTWINYGYNGWSYKWKASVRYLGKTAQMSRSGMWCKRCINQYKDVNINAD